MISRKFVLALALAAATAGARAATPAPDVATDPAGAWKHFMANADFEKVYPAFDVLDSVGYSMDGVDAARCAQHSAALRAAVETVPVSVAMHRAAMLCAEAAKDDAGAERELKAVAALARHALKDANDSSNAPEIRIVRAEDAYALLAAAGSEFRYEYYDGESGGRTVPLVVAAWDPERKRERHLRFDYIEVAHDIARTPAAKYPLHRIALVNALMEGPSSQVPVLDMVAQREAGSANSVAERIAKLRAGAAMGGIGAMRTWITLCARDGAPKGCADGLVDAILPFAEQQHALPMTYLAFAYDRALGVKRDAAAADRLLDAADQRWANGGASVAFIALWTDTRDGLALPAELRERAERAAAAGNADARMHLWGHQISRNARQIFRPLPADAVAFLSQREQNGIGRGYAILAAFALLQDKPEDRLKYLRLSAESGSAASQAALGFALVEGKGVPKDKVAGERWLEAAADGGHIKATHHIVDQREAAGDYAAAEHWLLGVAGNDTDAAYDLAWLYEWEKPGVSEGVDAAVRIYTSLADAGDTRARRELVDMALAGRGMAKDPAKARTWLLAIADQDPEAASMLANHYLRGTFGAVDEREGERWAERAIDKGSWSIASEYGYWLYYKRATPDARRKALALWRKDLAKRSYSANNLAWVLCTSPNPDEYAPAEGLKAVAEMGRTADALDTAELDTAAACQAATGNFAKARELQSLALKAHLKDLGPNPPAEDDENTKEFNARLALYAAGKPYRDTR